MADVSRSEGETELQNAWCFWHDNPKYNPGEDYEASLQKLCTFNTVEGFWKCFNNMPGAEKLRNKASFYLMKAGIRPTWEDPNNAEGGNWTLRIKVDDTNFIWRELVLAAIGEQFSPVLNEGDDICGVSVSIRNSDNIVQLWTKSQRNKSQRVINRIQELAPNVQFITTFYKGNKEHLGFQKK